MNSPSIFEWNMITEYKFLGKNKHLSEENA